MASAAPLSTHSVEVQLRSQRRLLAIVAALVAAVTGIAVAQLIFGNAIAVAILCAVIVGAIVWTKPWTGVIILAMAATVVEQFSLVAEGTFSDGTDHIPFFQSLNSAAGLGGIYATPFELFLALLLGVWLIKGFASRSLRLPRTKLSFWIGTLALIVAFTWVHGVATGGSFSDSLLELRPWLYVAIAFVASSQLIKDTKHLRVLIAVMAVGIGIKAMQGLLTLVIHWGVRPQAILAHEESFFFGVFIAVLAGLWILPIKGRLRTMMTALFPFVLVADIANQRRTAWAIAGATLIIVFVLAFIAVPERRKTIAMFALVGVILGGIYWLRFSNDPGLLGQPARAVLSQLAPTARDQASNQYRTVENVDLGIAIRLAMPFGTGFGHPIPQFVPNVNISDIDTFITYLPHNTVLHVWLRMGIFGIISFWMVIGLAIISAIQVIRRRPSEITLLISVTLVVVLVAYVIQGFFDMGLYWFRIAITVGFLLGAFEAARRLEGNPTTR
ncbi:MAG: hypothetical protein E6I95_03710 [Chloroflexi bacterium]|nr:MAG: hypothetical protein E6I95_03710 [Chloroflexota bacterium]